MSNLLRTMRRRHQVIERKRQRKAAFAAYLLAMEGKGEKPMPKSEWRKKWAEG